MKRFLFAICLFLMYSSAVSAQPARPGRGELAVRYLSPDFQFPLTKMLDPLKSAGTELEFGWRISPFASISLPLRAAQVEFPGDTLGIVQTGLWGNADLQFHLRVFPAGSRFNPWMCFGIGAELEEGSGVRVGIPVGGGVDFRLARGLFLAPRLEYRYSHLERREQLLMGVGMKFTSASLSGTAKKNSGKALADPYNVKDLDGDKVPDGEDECPSAPGPKALKGCPDRDEDGVADYLDKCPDVPGTLEGCPDADNDGIPDKDDQCPLEVGPASRRGCPDTDRDGDGVENKLDACPDVPGSPAAKGCPDRDNDGVADDADSCPEAPGPPETRGCPDSDLDGIPDKDDRCPNTPGMLMPDGCPEIDKDDLSALLRVTSQVQFETGSDRLKTTSFEALDQVATLMRKYPDFSLQITGHTDNVGNAQANLTLSENRAQVCYEYLISRGIGPSRMEFKGMGGTKPIASNKTAAGKALNRRVEFVLSK